MDPGCRVENNFTGVNLSVRLPKLKSRAAGVKTLCPVLFCHCFSSLYITKFIYGNLYHYFVHFIAEYSKSIDIISELTSLYLDFGMILANI